MPQNMGWELSVQKRRAIAYLNHTLSLSDRGKPMYERELMVVVMTV